jgi:hypothetical protein
MFQSSFDFFSWYLPSGSRPGSVRFRVEEDPGKVTSSGFNAVRCRAGAKVRHHQDVKACFPGRGTPWNDTVAVAAAMTRCPMARGQRPARILEW